MIAKMANTLIAAFFNCAGLRIFRATTEIFPSRERLRSLGLALLRAQVES
jgi:hypothetical protein